MRGPRSVRALKVTSLASPATPNVAFLFSGLGGEVTGVPAWLTSSKAFLRTMEEVEALLVSIYGESSRIVWAPQEEARLRTPRQLFAQGRSIRTASTPPTLQSHASLFAMQCALANAWIEMGVEPEFVAGYSLGEYSAACVAGVFELADGLRLVTRRAEILATQSKGGLVAVSSTLDAVRRYLPPDTFLVASNTNIQTIIGGTIEALATACESLKTAGFLTQIVASEYPFHTPLLSAAGQQLAGAVTSTPRKPPKIPFVSTRTGRLLSPAAACSPEHWARHLTEPVRFADALESLQRAGVRTFLEVGPDQSLAPAVQQTFRGQAISVLSSLPSKFDHRPAPGHFLRTAGELWLQGAAINSIPALPSSGRSEKPLLTRDTGLSRVASQIREVWCEVLCTTSFGVDDNLYDLGADSLVVARIANRLRSVLGLTVSAKEILSNPTPRLLSSLFSGSASPGRLSSIDLLKLPNGLSVRYQSRAEALYFYESIFVDRAYLQHGLTLEPGGTVFDVGANIGMFSMFAALEEPTSRIFSFEPIPILHDALKFNLIDLTDRAETFQFGLSSRAGDANITFYPENSGMSSFRPNLAEEQHVLRSIVNNGDHSGKYNAPASMATDPDFVAFRLRSEQVPVTLRTLSQVIHDHGVSRIGFLKIDVQKLELEVLLGIADKHWCLIQQVAAEVHDDHDRLDLVCRLLESRGFNLHTQQDSLYVGTNIHNVYARRS